MANRTDTLRKLFPLLRWWPLVDRRSLRDDFLAGVTGAVIVLPQGVAFALIAGLPPEYGLYSAIVIPVVAALFGSSLHLVSGPTTATSLVIFAAVSELAEPATAVYIGLVLTLTLLAGLVQLGLGLARLGVLTNFVSHTVVVGFTAGAAILIATSQVQYVLGIEPARQADFLSTWREIFRNLTHANPYALSVAIVTLFTAAGVHRLSGRLPHLLVALIAGSVLALLLGGAAAGIDFVGAMPSRLPPFDPPPLSGAGVKNVATSAVAVALLGLIQTMTLARVISARSGQRVDSNQEFIGQGLSNIVGSFFSAYAGAGSLTRSGVNYDAGAKTPLAAVFASVLLAVFLLLVGPLTAYLPMAAMGGVILVVAYNLVEFPQIRTILRTSRREQTVLLVTFFATLFLELELAIFAGVILSLLFYLLRTAHPHIAVMAPDPAHPRRRFVNTARNRELRECPQIKVVRIDGSLYYGAVDHVAAYLQELQEAGPQRRLLILAHGVNFIDVTGAEFLAREAERWRSLGGDLYLAGLKRVAQDELLAGGYRDRIGEDHFFATKREAIAAIYEHIPLMVCGACPARVFTECEERAERWEREAAGEGEGD